MRNFMKDFKQTKQYKPLKWKDLLIEIIGSISFFGCLLFIMLVLFTIK